MYAIKDAGNEELNLFLLQLSLLEKSLFECLTPNNEGDCFNAMSIKLFFWRGIA
jgi:hypothetical protein